MTRAELTALNARKEREQRQAEREEAQRVALRRRMAIGGTAAVFALLVLSLLFASVESDEAAFSASVPSARLDADGPVAVAQPTPAVTEPAGAGDDVIADRIEAVVESWADCWSDQDIDCYLGHYSTAFEPDDSLDPDSWRVLRRERLGGPAWIEVTISSLASARSADGLWRAEFVQDYRSDTFSDQVFKTLWLRQESGGWLIVGETSVPLESSDSGER